MIEITVWKFCDFSIAQILREINFGDSRSAKYAISTHLEIRISIFSTLYFFCQNLKIPKDFVLKLPKTELLGSLKWAIFGIFAHLRVSNWPKMPLFDSAKSISHNKWQKVLNGITQVS